MKHHKHHEKHHGHHEKHHDGHHKHHGHDGHSSKAYPGISGHRQKYGDGIYCYLNEGHEERHPTLEMGGNPKWHPK